MGTTRNVPPGQPVPDLPIGVSPGKPAGVPERPKERLQRRQSIKVP